MVGTKLVFVALTVCIGRIACVELVFAVELTVVAVKGVENELIARVESVDEVLLVVVVVKLVANI